MRVLHLFAPPNAVPPWLAQRGEATVVLQAGYGLTSAGTTV